MHGSSLKAKKALVDPYAEIALFDSAENQRVILEAQRTAAEKKTQLKKSLDAQVRYQQEALLREREEDREWLKMEQDRIQVWNREERNKIEETKRKNDSIKAQREQQLRELAAMRSRDNREQQAYDLSILEGIRKDIVHEKAKEAIKRASDAENLKRVAEQNVIHQEFLRQEKHREAEAMRALEAQWSEVLDKQERQRDRQLKMTYSRQAKQYGTAATMQEEMERIAKEDQERADRHAREIEEAAAKRESDQIAERRRLQQETLDVLSIQVREKQARAGMEREREAMVVMRESGDMKAAESADERRRAERRKKNEQYKAELMHQMEVQEQRKVLEPFLMSKAERQMNAALLRRLPAD